jgi:hypothetical protein
MLIAIAKGPDCRGAEEDPIRGTTELWLISGDGMNQAADLASGATSISSWNLTPWMTFGNWFDLAVFAKFSTPPSSA